MKKARLISLGFVAVCGLTAIYLVLDKPEPAPAPAPIAVAPPPVAKEQILVAAHELNFGSVIQPTDVAWQDWPKDSPIQGVIRKAERPNAVDEIKDSVVRGSFLTGEPMRAERLFKGASSGFLSAVLAPGYRAVAINIEGSGATTAGNFVLPNDRVDVVHIYRDDDAAKSGAGDAFVSETLVTNVRVLAIGQNANDKGGPPTAGGSTATLELDPRQAETVILAQRIGQLSLILRSMQDSAKQAGGSVSSAQQIRDRGVTIVRAGIATQSRGK
ncbi:pilus assembly protein CpaB [Rhodoblastus acidophilus]|uniref:Pilus assembly protein CpaB n=1 Tax=Rhodoblastus acidophilus TaxID=1074 RepID=A0A212R215_RHOAC|nr:Flp pilus assembly protein CpaB [Rhodoblastus acidophilus]PPQ40338.1 Flp pilus assembly protein CpaB [Rhodoblastus acidophilus]RAI16404.1 Flp pilus assembly protein CpaB [Rhodoblastus acidophilus]SNB66035.1 pilus assembly protein CpaB [Rhodoblastus acidophilus]